MWNLVKNLSGIFFGNANVYGAPSPNDSVGESGDTFRCHEDHFTGPPPVVFRITPTNPAHSTDPGVSVFASRQAGNISFMEDTETAVVGGLNVICKIQGLSIYFVTKNENGMPVDNSSLRWLHRGGEGTTWNNLLIFPRALLDNIRGKREGESFDFSLLLKNVISKSSRFNDGFEFDFLEKLSSYQIDPTEVEGVRTGYKKRFLERQAHYAQRDDEIIGLGFNGTILKVDKASPQEIQKLITRQFRTIDG